jgi:hypothetical protein
MQDVVAELRVGVKDLAAERRDGWSAPALNDRLGELVEVREALHLEVIRAVAEWDALAAWGDDGAVTAPTWLTHRFPITRAEAADLVRLGRLRRRYREVADAMDRGELSVAHIRALVRAERNREDWFARSVAGLVGLAGETETLEEFTEVLVEWSRLVDDRCPREARRGVKFSEVGDDARFQVDTGPDELAIIRAALTALDSPDPEDCPEGPRTREQRWHDLTIDVFRRVLADEVGKDPAAVGSADVVLDADVAVELVEEPDPTLTDERDPMEQLLDRYRRRDDGTLEPRRCHHPDGTRASRAFVAALMCSGWMRRILRDPRTGGPIDVGRAHRRFTPRQVRALMLRDGGCAFPGCDRPPKWCDAHHLKPWQERGPTDLDNGCLLCRRHHVLVHSGGWTLVRDTTTGVFTATAPDGRQFHRRPGRHR